MGAPRLHNQKSVCRRLGAFSLIEVIAAVAIFAFGMIAVLGMYAPVTKSVVAVSDAESAARVADAVRSRLRSVPFATALTLVQEVADVRRKDGDGAYNPNATRPVGEQSPVLFGKLDGEVGIYNPAEGRRRWEDSRNAVVADADKFFEIDLIRNDAITPQSGDATAPMVAYTIRVRWPAFIRTTTTTAVQSAQNPSGGSVTFDHGRKQVLFFTGAITR